MDPVTTDDLVLDLDEWQRVFEQRRPEMIAYRQARRVPLGELITLDFEDRATVAWQVNRMIGVERIHDHEKINHELATYNQLVPGYQELSATMLIGIDDMEELRRWKPKLVGINDKVFLEIDGERVRLIPDEEGTRENEPPMVQYLKFVLTDAQAEALRTEGTSVVVGVDHPDYRQRVELGETQRATLATALG